MRIAMLGTRGVPARYGGFETAVEEIGRRLANRGHKVTVFCRDANLVPSPYLGMELVHLPSVRHKVAETLSHTALSVLHHAARSADAAILFNAANAAFLPVLRAANVPTALHVDGLEWRRSKWGSVGRRYYLVNERLAVKWAQVLIADAKGIQDYYRQTYRADSVYIAYGAPVVVSPALSRLADVGLSRQSYHLVVARFEPENHVHLALEGYVQSGGAFPLVVVGSAPYSEDYVRSIRAVGDQHPNILMLGPIWDQEFLNALYAGSLTYIHGHSVGGTNPSLLRAMGAGAPVAAFDVNFNREVLGPAGTYWKDAADLALLIQQAEQRPDEAAKRGVLGNLHVVRHYNWDSVSDDYEALCRTLIAQRRRRS